MKHRPETTGTANREFYTTTQVAEIFGVTAETVRDWISTGKLQAIRLPGGHYRVTRAAVESYGASTYEATPVIDEQSSQFL